MIFRISLLRLLYHLSIFLKALQYLKVYELAFASDK